MSSLIDAVKRMVEWRNRRRSIKKLKHSIRRTIAIRKAMLNEEIHAATFEQVKYVVFELNGNVRFVASNLRSMFGEQVECVNRERHRPLWEFEELKHQHYTIRSLAYLLRKRLDRLRAS